MALIALNRQNELGFASRRPFRAGSAGRKSAGCSSRRDLLRRPAADGAFATFREVMAEEEETDANRTTVSG